MGQVEQYKRSEKHNAKLKGRCIKPGKCARAVALLFNDLLSVNTGV